MLAGFIYMLLKDVNKSMALQSYDILNLMMSKPAIICLELLIIVFFYLKKLMNKITNNFISMSY